MTNLGLDGEEYPQASTHQQEWGARFIAGLATSRHGVVLELGCGDGALTAHLP
jgi:16S rRNA A1518/A1519 N6-dimethyltransferase RsmA/KsgA/DIM1 with predicted DNA glycosylase/AP lyase activity